MQVLRAMRQELFRTLLMGKIEFFDAHSTAQLTSLISVEMDTLRSFVFGNVSRDRGARAILEAVGSVLVRARRLLDLPPLLVYVMNPSASRQGRCVDALLVSFALGMASVVM